LPTRALATKGARRKQLRELVDLLFERCNLQDRQHFFNETTTAYTCNNRPIGLPKTLIRVSYLSESFVAVQLCLLRGGHFLFLDFGAFRFQVVYLATFKHQQEQQASGKC